MPENNQGSQIRVIKINNDWIEEELANKKQQLADVESMLAKATVKRDELKKVIGILENSRGKMNE